MLIAAHIAEKFLNDRRHRPDGSLTVWDTHGAVARAFTGWLSDCGNFDETGGDYAVTLQAVIVILDDCEVRANLREDDSTIGRTERYCWLNEIGPDVFARLLRRSNKGYR